MCISSPENRNQLAHFIVFIDIAEINTVRMNSSNLGILEIISENHANDRNAEEEKKYNRLLASSAIQSKQMKSNENK